MDVAAVNRNPGVLRGVKLVNDVVNVVFNVDADDFVARHHDVVHGDLLQVENAQQHFLVTLGDEAACFMDQGAQLFPAQMVAGCQIGTGADQTEHNAGDQVDEPDQGVEHFEKRAQDVTCRKSDFFREVGGQGLGGNLAKEQ